MTGGEEVGRSFAMEKPLKIAAVCICAALALAGCAKGEKPDYNLANGNKDLMTGVVDPASFKIWNASGEDVTDAGAKSRDPTTDKAWAEVRGAAVAVMEAGNLMMLPGRAYDADWIKKARAMSDAAETVKAAADAHDGKRIFETGGKLYETCGGCHEKYYIPYVSAGKPVPPPPKA